MGFCFHPFRLELSWSPSDVICRLNAYYEFIHAYLPVLPPRVAPRCVDQPLSIPESSSQSSSEGPVLMYRPVSPLSLAISAILALIPHPSDAEPSSASSVLRRRAYANQFAQLATSSIEADGELLASSTDPSKALSGERPLPDREPLHPRTPVELESILALLILSVYEYAQRGNILKMKSRASQALAIALDMSLHSLGEDHSEFAEARRRAWWMTVRRPFSCCGSGCLTFPYSTTLSCKDLSLAHP